MAKKMKIKDIFSFSKIQLIHKINSLEVEKGALEDTIKDELFKHLWKNYKNQVRYHD